MSGKNIDVEQIVGKVLCINCNWTAKNHPGAVSKAALSTSTRVQNDRIRTDARLPSSETSTASSNNSQLARSLGRCRTMRLSAAQTLVNPIESVAGLSTNSRACGRVSTKLDRTSESRLSHDYVFKSTVQNKEMNEEE